MTGKYIELSGVCHIKLINRIQTLRFNGLVENQSSHDIKEHLNREVRNNMALRPINLSIV